MALDDHIARLREQVIGHRNFRDALDELFTQCSFAPDGALIQFFGPTGAGKSTVLGKVEQRLYRTDDRKEASFIPCIAVSLANAIGGSFSWRDFFFRALRAMDDPLLDQPVRVTEQDRRRLLAQPMSRLRDSEHQLRMKFEAAVDHRRTRFVLIDEAQLLLRTTHRRRAIDQVDAMRTLASATGTVVVLAGTYEMLGLWNLSAQLNRRCRDVHLSRYRRAQEDLLEFERILETLTRVLPLRSGQSLRSWNAYLYEGSFGCIGILKEWIERALVEQNLRKSPYLLLEHFKARAFQPAQQNLIRDEIEGGERLMSRETPGAELEMAAPARSKRSTRRPGTRNPKRDPVGRR